MHAGGDLLGECPVWDDRTGLLHRVDALAGTVISLDPGTGAERRVELGVHVGSLVLRADGRGVLVAAGDGFGALDPSTGTYRPLADVLRGDPAVLMNDGACDPAGRFLAGTMSRDATPGRGALYGFRPPDRAEPVLSGVGISNGLAWDSTGSALYFVDTLLRRVDRLGYDVGTGAVTDRRPAVDLSGYPGLPDGMTIDAEDCLWVAFWRGGAVRRFSPAGELLQEVVVPVLRTTSCCLGGPDLRDLYVTTARRGIRAAPDAVEDLAGGVFRCRVAVPGVPEHRWTGS
ncbi:SMP-30/gluconolactonase/LRE family protein [Trujillonella humicola]|uniref:SMP-30/gluconolactonase/LRE family protein n=1 Tax=Trujillonella humicola TaxID=3383699 RepID=UPI003905AF91